MQRVCEAGDFQRVLSICHTKSWSRRDKRVVYHVSRKSPAIHIYILFFQRRSDKFDFSYLNNVRDVPYPRTRVRSISLTHTL